MNEEIVSSHNLAIPNILSDYQERPLEDLRSDHTLRGAVERYLGLAIESCLDIGEMIISREGLKKPETYREVIEILGDANILPKDFAERFASAAGFRNLLIHRYTDIDTVQLYSFLQDKLEDFEEFSKTIADYLSR